MNIIRVSLVGTDGNVGKQFFLDSIALDNELIDIIHNYVVRPGVENEYEQMYEFHINGGTIVQFYVSNIIYRKDFDYIIIMSDNFNKIELDKDEYRCSSNHTNNYYKYYVIHNINVSSSLGFNEICYVDSDNRYITEIFTSHVTGERYQKRIILDIINHYNMMNGIDNIENLDKYQKNEIRKKEN